MNTRKTRVKICCISSSEEAKQAITAGADALGLVGDMPSGPGIITDETARSIAAGVPSTVNTFLLTSRERGSEIAEHVQYCGVSTVQIVNHIDPAEYPRITEDVPGVQRIQVIHVEDASALDLIEIYAPLVHAFLLDSGRPRVAELGGTGRTHDWSISKRFVECSPVPVFLAGGLNAANVGEAISTVRPYGVDLCTGVRTNGSLDPSKLATFIAAVRQAEIPG